MAQGWEGSTRDTQGETELCGFSARAEAMAATVPVSACPPLRLTGAIFPMCVMPPRWPNLNVQ